MLTAVSGPRKCLGVATLFIAFGGGEQGILPGGVLDTPVFLNKMTSSNEFSSSMPNTVNHPQPSPTFQPESETSNARSASREKVPSLKSMGETILLLLVVVGGIIAYLHFIVDRGKKWDE